MCCDIKKTCYRLLTKWSAAYQLLGHQVRVSWLALFFGLPLDHHPTVLACAPVIRFRSCRICRTFTGIPSGSGSSCAVLIWVTIAYETRLKQLVLLLIETCPIHFREVAMAGACLLTSTTLMVVVRPGIHHRRMLITVRIMRVSCAEWRTHCVFKLVKLLFARIKITPWNWWDPNLKIDLKETANLPNIHIENS